MINVHGIRWFCDIYFICINFKKLNLSAPFLECKTLLKPTLWWKILYVNRQFLFNSMRLVIRYFEAILCTAIVLELVLDYERPVLSHSTRRFFGASPASSNVSSFINSNWNRCFSQMFQAEIGFFQICFPMLFLNINFIINMIPYK